MLLMVQEQELLQLLAHDLVPELGPLEIGRDSLKQMKNTKNNYQYYR